MGKTNKNFDWGNMAKNGRLIVLTISDNQAAQYIADNIQRTSNLLSKKFGSYDVLVNLCGSALDTDTLNKAIESLCSVPFKRIAICSTCSTKLRVAKCAVCRASDANIKIFASESKALHWINKSILSSTITSKLTAISSKNTSY